MVQKIVLPKKRLKFNKDFKQEKKLSLPIKFKIDKKNVLFVIHMLKTSRRGRPRL